MASPYRIRDERQIIAQFDSDGSDFEIDKEGSCSEDASSSESSQEEGKYIILYRNDYDMSECDTTTVRLTETV